MLSNSHRSFLKCGLLATTLLAAPHIVWADDDDQGDSKPSTLQLPSDQMVTPTAPLTNALQQDLNPGLPGYSKFVAGEAVRSVLSPDGTTLAIITAGQNSLYDKTGAVDTANSTQYIFLYNVSGASKTAPKLIQVIK